MSTTRYRPPLTELLQSWPAWDIYRAPATRSWALDIEKPIFRDRDVVGLPWETKRYGTQYHWYTFGSVASFAIGNDDCPIRAYHRAKEKGHKLHWLNANATVLSNQIKPKENRVALDWGDEIVFEGRLFRVEKAPNQNASLVEVEISA